MRYSAVLGFLASVACHSIDTSSAAQAHLLSARDLCKREITCILAAEATEGPFYIISPLVRSCIAEDRAGATFNLEIQVIDVRSCEPVSDVWVDIWHADADGVYSGWATGKSLEPIAPMLLDEYDSSIFNTVDFQAQGGLKKRGIPIDDTRFLRGVQRSKKGRVQFDTIVPGWYRGRADHIHVRVHSSNSSIVDGHLLGGTVSHTGQFYFDNAFVQELKDSVAPYNTRTLEPKKNEDDFPYIESRGYEQIIKISTTLSGSFHGKVVVGIDPSAIHPPGFGKGPHDGPPGGPHHGRPGYDGHPLLQNIVLGFFVIVVLLGAVVFWKAQQGSRSQGHEQVASDQR